MDKIEKCPICGNDLELLAKTKTKKSYLCNKCEKYLRKILDLEDGIWIWEIWEAKANGWINI